MKCWRCSKPIDETVTTCPDCGMDIKRLPPVTKEGKILRRIYDDLGAKEVLNSTNILVSSINDLLSDSDLLCQTIQLAYSAGFGKLYFMQLSSEGRPTDDFYGRVTRLLVDDAGLSEKRSNELIGYFDEMIGWTLPGSKNNDTDSYDNKRFSYCVKCGCQILSNSRFCQYCGTDQKGFTGSDKTVKSDDNYIKSEKKAFNNASNADQTAKGISDASNEIYNKSLFIMNAVQLGLWVILLLYGIIRGEQELPVEFLVMVSLSCPWAIIFSSIVVIGMKLKKLVGKVGFINIISASVCVVFSLVELFSNYETAVKIQFIFSLLIGAYSMVVIVMTMKKEINYIEYIKSVKHYYKGNLSVKWNCSYRFKKKSVVKSVKLFGSKQGGVELTDDYLIVHKMITESVSVNPLFFVLLIFGFIFLRTNQKFALIEYKRIPRGQIVSVNSTLIGKNNFIVLDLSDGSQLAIGAVPGVLSAINNWIKE